MQQLKDMTNGLLLGRYRVLKFIQLGSYGRVFKCFDTKDSRICSVKVIPSRFANVGAHEIKVLTKLNGCENICQLINHHSTSNGLYIVLEYCRGGDLHEYRKNRIVSSRELYLVAKQLYNAICFAHSRGVYHRDLKPENILLLNIRSLKGIKLCDWGLSTTTRINNEFNVGTEKFMAPEVFINNYNFHLNLTCYDAKYVDYWSFGISLITFLFGRSPFKSVNGKSLIHDGNYKRFVMLNEKLILYDIYPNLNSRGYNIFLNLFRISGIDDNSNDFLMEIKSRDISKFMHQLYQNYQLGLTLDESEFNDLSIDIVETVRNLDYRQRMTNDLKVNRFTERGLLVDEFSLNWFDY